MLRTRLAPSCCLRASRPTGAALVAGLLLGACPLAQAGRLEALVSDPGGAPVENAVLVLHGGNPSSAPAADGTGVMDQRDKQFAPPVIAVRSGTAVSFPNSDDIRHHVYSFSAPKPFELRLYEGTPTEPVVFDVPGVVVLGCNIHDWMIGHIYVTDSAWFGVTDAGGRLLIADLPAGEWRLSLWHPWLSGEPPAPVSVTVSANAPAVLRLQVAVSEAPEGLKPPDPLQHLFRDATHENP